MNDVAIIGAGKVGTALGQALSKTGYRIIALTCSRISSARKSQKIIGQGTAYRNSTQAAREADIVILSVPDDIIRSVSEDLSGSDFQWDGKYVFHCSGLLPSHILDDSRLPATLLCVLPIHILHSHVLVCQLLHRVLALEQKRHQGKHKTN